MTDQPTTEAGATDDGRAAWQESIVAVIDALGVKHIWRGDLEPSDVIDALRTAKRKASEWAEFQDFSLGGPVLVRAFSDSVIVASAMGDSPRAFANWTASVVAELGTAAVNAKVPLAYRGCIAVGRLATAEEFFVGPAIDEAARGHQEADAALTWVTPATRKRSLLDDSQVEFLEWAVPMKVGGPVQVLVVNPLWVYEIGGPAIAGEDVAGKIDNLISRLLTPFARDDGLDVVRKCQNTAAFLEAAREHTLKMIPAEIQRHRQMTEDVSAMLEGDT
jgi:hypothetical protein